MNKTDFLISHSEDLSRLYYEERLTTRQIGKLFGTSKHPVEDAMQQLGFERRKTKTKGIKPSREFLQKAIFEDARSLMDIANELNCDPGAVKFWANEYRIEVPKMDTWSQRNKQRGYERPSRNTLENLYHEQKFSLSAIAEMFGVSRQAIKDAFTEYGIELRTSGWRKSFMCKDSHLVKSSYERRVDDWLFENGINHEYEPVLPFGNMKADFLAKGIYIEIFGVIHNSRYSERKARKIECYRSHGLHLVIINYWDFTSQNKDRWIRKLQSLLE